jgi:hypothetical protein
VRTPLISLRLTCSATCKRVQGVISKHYTMARICSSQKNLAYRCKLLADRVRVLVHLVGAHPTLAPLEDLVSGVIEIATCQLFLSSRTIHTPLNPWMSTTEFLPNFSQLAEVLCCSLSETTKVLTTALTNLQILDSLDILPMCLRRHYEQLSVCTKFSLVF